MSWCIQLQFMVKIFKNLQIQVKTGLGAPRNPEKKLFETKHLRISYNSHRGYFTKLFRIKPIGFLAQGLQSSKLYIQSHII